MSQLRLSPCIKFSFSPEYTNAYHTAGSGSSSTCSPLRRCKVSFSPLTSATSDLNTAEYIHLGCGCSLILYFPILTTDTAPSSRAATPTVREISLCGTPTLIILPSADVPRFLTLYAAAPLIVVRISQSHVAFSHCPRNYLFLDVDHVRHDSIQMRAHPLPDGPHRHAPLEALPPRRCRVVRPRPWCVPPYISRYEIIY